MKTTANNAKQPGILEETVSSGNSRRTRNVVLFFLVLFDSKLALKAWRLRILRSFVLRSSMLNYADQQWKKLNTFHARVNKTNLLYNNVINVI